MTIKRPVETSWDRFFFSLYFWHLWKTEDQTTVPVFISLKKFWSWLVQSWSSAGFFPVLGPDFQALIFVTLGLLTLSTTLLSVLVANMRNTSLTAKLPIKCKTESGNKIVKKNVLLDTGAGGMFVHQECVKKHRIVLHKL